MRDFKTLTVWQKASDFVTRIYELTADFPNEEKFGITSQLRRATVSVPVNIAEGCGRDSNKETARFVSIASGSASEVECLLYLSCNLGLIDGEEVSWHLKEIVAIKKMLHRYRQHLISEIPDA